MHISGRLEITMKCVNSSICCITRINIRSAFWLTLSVCYSVSIMYMSSTKCMV